LIPLSRINTQAGAAIDTLYGLDGSTHAKITDPNRIQLIQKHSQERNLSGGACEIAVSKKAPPSGVIFDLMNALILAAGYATRLYPLRSTGQNRCSV